MPWHASHICNQQIKPKHQPSPAPKISWHATSQRRSTIFLRNSLTLQHLKQKWRSFTANCSHCTGLSTTKIYHNRQLTTKGFHVHIPNCNTMTITHINNLDITELTHTATSAHIFQDLTNWLISVDQLCSNGFQAMFTTNNITIMHSNSTILDGKHNNQTGLWNLVTK